MALIICPDCKKSISSGADKCLHCGRSMVYWTPGRILIGVLMVVFIFGVPSYCLRVTVTPTTSTYSSAPSSFTAYPSPTVKSTPQLSNDDAKILEKIKTKAQKQFPDDYSTQKYEIESQMEAYNYMKTVPSSKLKSKAEKEFPLDFSTQKYEYDSQMKAKQELEASKPAPSNTPKTTNQIFLDTFPTPTSKKTNNQ